MKNTTLLLFVTVAACGGSSSKQYASADFAGDLSAAARDLAGVDLATPSDLETPPDLEADMGPAHLRIFVTATMHDGNTGASFAADAICANDANKPSTGTYKAMLSTASRHACTSANCLLNGVSENLDWVFHANRAYDTTSGTLIGTTGPAATFNFPVSAAFGSAIEVYTGINANWTNATSNCSNFTSNVSSQSGVFGAATSTMSGAIDDGTVPCNTALPIYCVEQ